MIIHGSMSIRRYFIEDDAEITPETINRALSRNSFQPINDHREERESWGWVNPFDLINGKLHLDVLDLGDKFLALGIRRDKKTISPAVFKARRKEAISALLRERGVKRLSKDERSAVEATIRKEMFTETSATTALMDAIWLKDEKVLLVGVTGANSDRVAMMFTESFGATALPATTDSIARKDKGIIARHGEQFFDSTDAFKQVHNAGPDFLTWLLVHFLIGDLSGLVAATSKDSDISITVDRSIVIVQEGESMKVDGEECAGKPEIAKGIKAGGRVSSMKITVVSNGISWTLGIDHNLDLKGLKSAVPKVHDEREFANSRVDSIIDFYRAFDVLFSTFLTVRVDPTKWEAELGSWQTGLSDD